MKVLLVLVVLLSQVFAFAQVDTTQPMEAPQSEPPVGPEPVAAAPPSYGETARWRFAIGLGFSPTSKLKFDSGNATVAGTVYPFSAELDYKSALVLSAEGRFQPQFAWGFLLGVQIDGQREFDGGSITALNTTGTISSSDNKIQITNVYANAAYRWEQFYLPFGLNLSSVNFKPASGFTGTSDASGGIGAQLGVGFLIKENISLELFSRALAVKLKSTSSGSTTDYGTGYLSSLLFQGKFIF